MSGLQGMIDIAFYAVVGLALSVMGFFFVMGAVSYASAGGDQQKVQQGMAGMRNSLIGAALIGGAGLIINFIVLDIVRPAGGEVGNVGQGLDCDGLLQQQLLASPLATANVNNANAVVSGIQAQRPKDCPPDTWNPQIKAAGATDKFPVDIPVTLQASSATEPKADAAFGKSPFRDSLGNIAVDFADAATTVTLPLNQAKRWMYLQNQGVWYSAR